MFHGLNSFFLPTFSDLLRFPESWGYTPSHSPAIFFRAKSRFQTPHRAWSVAPWRHGTPRGDGHGLPGRQAGALQADGQSRQHLDGLQVRLKNHLWNHKKKAILRSFCTRPSMTILKFILRLCFDYWVYWLWVRRITVIMYLYNNNIFRMAIRYISVSSNLIMMNPQKPS